MSTDIKILDTEPATEYEGTVHDQLVTVRFSDGTKLGLFDPDMIISSDMIGSQMAIEISLLTSPEHINQIGKINQGISPDTERPMFWQSHVYSGYISEKNTSSEFTELILDIGFGTVRTRLRSDEVAELSPDDALQTEATRSDIDRIS